MSSETEIEQVVAERHLVFVPRDGDREAVFLRVGIPVKVDDDMWYCPYELRASSHAQKHGMHGIDALQALELTMKTLEVEIDHWERVRKGKFHFLGEEGAGI